MSLTFLASWFFRTTSLGDHCFTELEWLWLGHLNSTEVSGIGWDSEVRPVEVLASVCMRWPCG